VIYADTSLLLPCYVPEEQSEEAQRVVETADAIAVSDVTVAELYVGLARKLRAGSLTRDQMERSRSFFEEHLSQGVYHRVALSPVHVAVVRAFCAESVASDLGAAVATFDKRLAEASRASGLTVVP
jgi:predicted nucleic acid-binding protein